MKKIINENTLYRIIKECVHRTLCSLNEAVNPEMLCGKLRAYQNRLGKIKTYALPEGANLEDITSDDIVKVTKNPDKEGVKIELEGGWFVVIRDDSAFVKNIKAIQQKKNDEKERWIAIKDKEMKDHPIGLLPDEPEKDPLGGMVTKPAEPAKPRIPRFTSVKQALEYLQERGIELDPYMVRSRRTGHDYYKWISLYYTSASYADGPSRPKEEDIELVNKVLRPLGFSGPEQYENNDERQFSSVGEYRWRKY